MSRCFKVDLKIENGYTLLMVFDAMKRMQQESDLIDESVTISYGDRIKITAGLYDSFDELDDLFMSIICCDKELIKKHAREVLSKYQDSEVIESAVENICESMEHMNQKFSFEEKEELVKLARLKNGYTKRKTRTL